MPASTRRFSIVLRVLAGLLLAIVVSGACFLVAVDSESGRARLCRELTEQVDESIRGTVRIGRCAEVGASLVRLEEIELFDPVGRSVLSIAVASVRIDVDALVEGNVHLHEVSFERPLVRLDEHDGRLDLAAAMEARTPRPTDRTEPSPFVIDVLRVTGGRIESLPGGLAISQLALELGASTRPALRVDLRSLEVTLSRQGAPVARLARARGVADLSPGGASRLDAVVESGADRATLGATAEWTATGPGLLHGTLALSISPDLLARFGQPAAAEALSAPVQATVVADGTADDLTVSVEVLTAGGSVTLAGRRVGEKIRARAETVGLDLPRVVRGVERGLLAGAIEALVQPSLEVPAEQQLDLTVDGARLDDFTLPRLTARVQVAPDHLRLAALAIPHLTGAQGHLDVTARLGFDGAADVRLDAHVPELAADANVHRLAPDLRGDLQARLSARVGKGEAPTLDVDGQVTMRRSAAAGLRAERLEVSGRVQGTLLAPELSLRVRGEDLRGAGLVLPEMELQIEGPPRRARLFGRLGLGRGRSSRVDLVTRVDGTIVGVDGTADLRGLWSSPLQMVLDGVSIDSAGPIEIGSLRIDGGRLHAKASGTLRSASGASSLSAEVQGLDLAELDRALALGRGLAGEADLELHYAGTPRDPDVTVRATLDHGRAFGMPIPAVALDARLDRTTRSFVASTTVRLGAAGSGHIEAQARGTLARGSDVVAAARAGSWDVEIAAADLPPELAGVLGRALGNDGRLDLRLRAQGTLEAPRVHLELAGRSRPRRGQSPLAIDSAVDVDPSQGHLTATATDAHGPLAALELRLSSIPSHPFEVVDPRAFLAGPWDLRLTVPDRRLDDWPVLAGGLDLPVRLRLDAALRGGPGPIEGDARVVVVAQTRRGPAVAGCRAGVPPELTMSLALRDGRTTVAARGTLEGAAVVDVHVEAATPIDDWLRNGLPPASPLVRATLQATDVPVEALPDLCGRASGMVRLTARAEGLFGDDPSVDLEGGVRALRWGRAPATDLALVATVRRALATLDARVRANAREAVHFEARLPVQWHATAPLLTLRDEPWEALLRLERAPIAPLLGAVATIERSSGALDGSVRVRGHGSDLQVDGTVDMQHVSFVVTDPPLRVGNLHGRLRLARDAVVIEGLSTRDGDGRLALDGRVGLAGLAPRSVDLRLRADDYPVRVSGVVFATVDGGATVQASLPEDPSARRTTRVIVHDLSVRLRDPTTRPLQTLDPHPDLVFEDAPRAPPATPAVEATGPPLHIEVDATRPFWVRRRDFSVQLSAALSVDGRSGGARIAGPVQVRRGSLDLVFRRFDLSPGEIRFDGGPDPSPILDLAAVHRLASRDTVTVRIRGRLPHPALTYSTTVPGVVTDLEILDLLGRDRGGLPTLRRSGSGGLQVDLGIASGLFASGSFEEPRSWSIDLGWQP